MPASSSRDLLMIQMEVTVSPLKRSRIKHPKRSLGRIWNTQLIFESFGNPAPVEVGSLLYQYDLYPNNSQVFFVLCESI